jgi:hypothetical protein
MDKEKIMIYFYSGMLFSLKKKKIFPSATTQRKEIM